jgi:hypothetical protein
MVHVAGLPPLPDLPFERQLRIVMDHTKRLAEADAYVPKG